MTSTADKEPLTRVARSQVKAGQKIEITGSRGLSSQIAHANDGEQLVKALTAVLDSDANERRKLRFTIEAIGRARQLEDPGNTRLGIMEMLADNKNISGELDAMGIITPAEHVYTALFVKAGRGIEDKIDVLDNIRERIENGHPFGSEQKQHLIDRVIEAIPNDSNHVKRIEAALHAIDEAESSNSTQYKSDLDKAHHTLNCSRQPTVAQVDGAFERQLKEYLESSKYEYNRDPKNRVAYKGFQEAIAELRWAHRVAKRDAVRRQALS